MKKKLVLLLACFAIIACSNDDNKPADTTKKPPVEEAPITPPVDQKKYKTENVILLVIDGPRMTETWLEKNKKYIPNRVELLKQGVFISDFQINGLTNTNAGHTALLTGVYDSIRNNGKELPTYPSVLQHWIKDKKADPNKAWVIVSKDKLEVLANTKHIDWHNQYMPSVDAGVGGLGTGYRSDEITMAVARSVMREYQPNIIVINLKDVDSYGHAKRYADYIRAITRTDESIKTIWNDIQSLPNYKDKTTFIVTNDHGRHTQGHKDGYVNHGDSCDGCRHIEFFALGPDFKQNTIINDNYEQIDVASTMAELLDVELPHAKGKVIKAIFKDK
ncbi:sulfatase-like hydrolase/transferase [Myroides injenensis]|uniref:sulfatase-like hydrolase/transferase n=1 Tax=Myroides injenensis TaxID=1183151 RepID=UPI000287C3FB|nr:sulfatase-like hydrolase/transferase [Myroides injenensis]